LKQVVATLKDELANGTSLPLPGAATKVGVAPDTLRNYAPELCGASSERWHSWRKSWTTPRNLAYGERVRVNAMRLANLVHS
jgi:hypothetical protein